MNSKSDIKPCALYLTVSDSELEARLKSRYGEDMEKLRSRLNQNKLDLMEYEKIKADFFAAVENSGNIEECTDKILEVFDGFCDK